MSYQVLAAQSPFSLAIRRDGKVFVRTPTAPDREIEWGAGEEDNLLPALVGKWGFDPVIDEDGEPAPEIEDDEIPIVTPDKAEDGSTVYRIRERVKYEIPA